MNCFGTRGRFASTNYNGADHHSIKTAWSLYSDIKMLISCRQPRKPYAVPPCSSSVHLRSRQLPCLSADIMASTSGVSQFPVLNPNTSLAFVTPPLAAQLEATRYLSVASLAVECSISWLYSGSILTRCAAGIYLGPIMQSSSRSSPSYAVHHQRSHCSLFHFKVTSIVDSGRFV
jgi:hypothetical protein